MTVPTRADFAVFSPIAPRWNDNDQYGHLNNTVYYEYFDTAVNGWLTEHCGPVTALDALGVVAETGCRYLSSASFPASLEVGFALRRLGKSSVAYELAVFPRGARTPHAVGHFVHVYVDPATRRPTVVPAPVATIVRTLPKQRERSGAL
ncbi:acyl-CoA thioesterase [Amycolatopsis dendrobii]|uniref:Acyl-CoA thioesterase n=1 Tax=Amycolatopsis dendrobii TaxID=2760662 RepID=A0A7W3W4J3_9PSEU|nr:thioesterase family protein [Amycolatopsis dendrobii]MBB1158147.1 acyl-CoA thioesterase [Amycolatopsis dendrobii]